MVLLDQIEKLINEHGSAVILKERIALANDKYAALETKATTLQSEKAALESEKAKLQKEKERLYLDLRQAKEKIRDLENNSLIVIVSTSMKRRYRYLPSLPNQTVILKPSLDSQDCIHKNLNTTSES